MATVQEYIGRAIAKSLRTLGQQIAGESELLSYFNLTLQGLYAAAARVNPSYFGTIADVAIETDPVDHWPWPADSNLIYYLQDITVEPTAEVAVVPYDDRQAEPQFPCVYMRGKAYYPAGLDTDPISDLRFWYSRYPVTAIALDEEIDEAWPPAMDDLIHYDIAMRLANKDGHAGDIANLGVERDRWLGLWVASLEHSNSIERRRRPSRRTFMSPSLDSLTGLLAPK